MDRQRTIRPLAATQVAALLEAAAKIERRLHPYLLTLARAGLRPSEGLALQWNDLTFKIRELRIERSLDASGHVVTTKMGRARGRRHECRARRRASSAGAPSGAPRPSKRGAGAINPRGFFSSAAGTPLDLSNVTNAWRRVLKATDLPSFRLYDFRHTFTTELLAQGRAHHLRRGPTRPHEADDDAPVACALASAR